MLIIYLRNLIKLLSDEFKSHKYKIRRGFFLIYSHRKAMNIEG